MTETRFPAPRPDKISVVFYYKLSKYGATQRLLRSLTKDVIWLTK